MKAAVYVCGGIAAYKAAEVVRGLQKAGAEVRIAMTSDAEKFIGKATFYALTHHEVYTSLYDNKDSAIPHIELADFADVHVVVPATANTLAKLAQGFADNVVTAALLAAHTPVVIAPAMNVHMWQNKATQANLTLLRDRGFYLVAPTLGALACGYLGEGKLAEVDDIVSAARIIGATQTLSLPEQRVNYVSQLSVALNKARLVITAGPTHEPIDPVRYLANRATGKLGYTLARAAALFGAQVTLISGPTTLTAPSGVQTILCQTAEELHKATLAAAVDAQAVICTAAVADYTPTTPSSVKLKKAQQPLEGLALTQTKDVLFDVAHATYPQNRPYIMGFAAETNNLVEYAQNKLATKGCDIIVANDVSKDESTFGADTNKVILVEPESLTEYPVLSLEELSLVLLSTVANHL